MTRRQLLLPEILYLKLLSVQCLTYTRDAKKCTWCLALSPEGRQTYNSTAKKITTTTKHLPISTHHLLHLQLTVKPIASMSIPLKDCVVALSGKFDETHGKQTLLGILSCFPLSSNVNTTLFDL